MFMLKISNKCEANLSIILRERDSKMLKISDARPHAQRILWELKEIRAGLIETVRELGEAHFGWEPQPGMRTCKNMLIEIGTMDKISRHLASHGELLDWNAVWTDLDRDGMESTLEALDEVRTETIAYLASVTEEDFQTPKPLPKPVQEYFANAEFIEPEELIRWIVRNEYYHYGQLNTYAALLSAK